MNPYIVQIKSNIYLTFFFQKSDAPPLTTVSRAMGMRPSDLISIAVHTPALTTAAMTLVRPKEAILITGGDVRTYTHTLASVLMSGNITSQARLYTATECVSQPHSHR